MSENQKPPSSDVGSSPGTNREELVQVIRHVGPGFQGWNFKKTKIKKEESTF